LLDAEARLIDIEGLSAVDVVDGHRDDLNSIPHICVQCTRSGSRETARVTSERKRRPGPDPRFTHEQLARRALAIMDAHGPDGLTMRELARELGMGTMALYRYFPSKEALMDAAVDLAAADINVPDAIGEPWRQQLLELAQSVYDAGRTHPSLARERFKRPLQSRGALKITDRAIALLLQAGLPEADAVAAFKAILIHTLGAAWFAASESDPAVKRVASHRHATLPAEQVPAMARVADELTAALGSDQAFKLGITALLDGIEARASQGSR
jgi:AcrR family transcriptional regulator